MTSTEEQIRKDTMERVLGNKSFVGDQEIVGIFTVKDNSDNIIFEFNPTTGLFTTYDTNGNIVWQVNTSTGIIVTGTKGALKVNDGANDRVLIGYQLNGFGVSKNYGIKVSREGYDVDTATDAQLIMSSKFTMPRENNISFGVWSYTNATSYEVLYNNACKIDFDDWPDSSCYLEVTGKTGGGTGSYSLRNVTDGSDVEGSEVTTTSTTATVFRSGAFTKPSGSKQLALQYKVSNASYYTDAYSCRVVMRYV